MREDVRTDNNPLYIEEISEESGEECKEMGKKDECNIESVKEVCTFINKV